MRTIRYGLLLVVVMFLLIAGTTWGQENPEPLFEAAAPPTDAPAAEEANGARRRYVNVDTSLIAGPEGPQQSRSNALLLELFDGQRYVALADSIERPTEGRGIWHGQLQGPADGWATLVVRDGVAAGNIRVGDRLYRLTYSGEGIHMLEELAAAEPMPEHQPIPVNAGSLETEAGPLATDEPLVSPSSDNGSVVDVLVVYTTASRQRYGQAGIQALIDLAVAETNVAYANSKINTRLLLVGTAEVGYSESGSMIDDLYRLRETGDGFLESVHSYRDTYAADTVTMIEEATDYCGIAFLMTTLSNSFEDYAFSVVDSDCATGYYSFGHELGHNMGSTHDHANGGNALYGYSFGHWASDYSFRTVMAYSCPGGCTRIQYFSNPSVFYQGLPTGIAYGSDPANAADNALSINQASYTVANWRDSASRLTAAPTGLSAVAKSPTRIDLSWQDQGVGELGFELQRRLAGKTWALIANLGPNSTSYQDNGVAADTTYEYRVRSYTQDQTSSYSNVASATTPRHPELHVGSLQGGGAFESLADPASFVWRANVIVVVHDAYHNPVNGATVSGLWSDGASGSGSCVTDGTGACLIVKSGLTSAVSSVTFSVSGISNGSDPYLPDHNESAAITLSKPVSATFLPLARRH